MVLISMVSRGRRAGKSEGVAFPRGPGAKRLLCLNGILPASVSHPPSLFPSFLLNSTFSACTKYSLYATLIIRREFQDTKHTGVCVCFLLSVFFLVETLYPLSSKD